MTRSAYYEELSRLAREKRAEYCVDTSAFGLREVRAIYKAEGICLDHWPLPRKIKALYMCDEGHCSVALQPNLPYEPKLFALIHELKHHYCDRAELGEGVIHCGDYDANELIEKGAEVFAAEFIYPEDEFGAFLETSAITQNRP
jgi:Zn-dependent peptidase ImmA (M78 family)